MINKCFIYYIEAISGSRVGWKYIGQSKSIKHRKECHFNSLINKEHYNIKLQRYFNKYGKKSLKFSILMECSENELSFWEKWWIKCFDSYKNGFNCTVGGERPPQQPYKPCTFMNCITKEIVKCISLREFADKYNLNYSSVCAVSNQVQDTVGDWYNPQGNYKPKYHTIISPKKKEYIIWDKKIHLFCREHNLEVENIRAMLRKVNNNSFGWTRPDSLPINHLCKRKLI